MCFASLWIFKLVLSIQKDTSKGSLVLKHSENWEKGLAETYRKPLLK
jgi:hypothetical protein